jgi:hypothetical protein
MYFLRKIKENIHIFEKKFNFWWKNHVFSWKSCFFTHVCSLRSRYIPLRISWENFFWVYSFSYDKIWPPWCNLQFNHRNHFGGACKLLLIFKIKYFVAYFLSFSLYSGSLYFPFHSYFSTTLRYSPRTITYSYALIIYRLFG